MQCELCFQHPNVFFISTSKTLTVGDVRENFPLPGHYHFRFKVAFKKTFVWRDGMAENATVPAYEKRIVAKVTRLRGNAQRRAPSAAIGHRSVSAPERRSSAAAEQRRSSQRQPQSRTRKDSEPLLSVGSASDSLLDVSDSSDIGNSPEKNQKERRYSDLLKMDDVGASPVQESSAPAGKKERRYSDLLKMDDSPVNESPMPVPTSGSNTGLGGGLGDLDSLSFSSSAMAPGMRSTSSSLDGMQNIPVDSRSGSRRSSGSISINAGAAGRQEKKRRASPRSQALAGLMKDFGGRS